MAGFQPFEINGGGGLAAEDVQAQIDAAIADLIDAAPGALDTLNELAAALGDDPNFAATVIGLVDAVEDDLDAHVNDTSGAHTASAISIVDAANDFTATDVEAALAELQSDAEADAFDLSLHVNDTSDAHDASAISVAPFSTIAATDVQAALEELLAEASAYSDEQAQDAVGTILVDTATIDFTYSDATPSITADVKNNSVTYAKLQDVSATDRILGRDTAGAGDVEELTVSGGLEFTGTGIQRSAFAGGDVTGSAASAVLTIPNDTVTNAKSADMAQSTIKGRAAAAGTGDPTDLTAAQVRTILDVPTNAEAILDTLIDAKGDLLVGTAADTVARKAAGTNGTFITYDSGQSDGLLAASPVTRFYTTHTWVVSGEVKVAVSGADFLPSMVVRLRSGQTAKLVEIVRSIRGGTSATFKMQEDGADISGFTGLVATTTEGTDNPADFTLTDGDTLAPVVTAVSATPDGMSITAVIEHTVTVTAT